MNKTDKRQYYQTWMTIVYDRSLTIVDIINPMHCMMLRFNENSIIGRNIMELQALADNPNKKQFSIIIENLKRACDENMNVFFDYVTTQKDGSTTSSICYGEWGLDDKIYVNTIKIDEDNIFEEHLGFTNYYLESETKNLSIGVYIRHFSEDGTDKYILFNDVAREFYERENVLESPYWNQGTDNLADKKELELNESLKVEKVIRDDYNNIKRWALFTKKRIKSQVDGFYVITTMIDITKRRQKDILLEQQFSLLNSVYKSLPMGIVIYDRNGNLVSLNQKDMDIFGVERKEDVMGVNIFDEPNTPQYIKDKIRNGETVEYELIYDFSVKGDYFKSLSNGMRVLAVKSSPIINKENKADGYLQICEDITEKRAQEKLNNLVFENIPVGVFVYDKNHTLISVNKRGCEIMGISYEMNLKGRNLFYDANMPESVKDELLKGNDVSYELDYNFDDNNLKFNTSNRGVKHLYIKISVIKNHNSIEGFLLINQDMSDLAQRERQIEQANIKLNIMFNSLSSGIEIYDKNGMLLDCNDHDIKILGIQDKASVINNSVSIYNNPNLSDDFLKNLREGKEVRYKHWYDFDIVKNNDYFGTNCTGKKCIEAKGSPMFTKKKELLGYVFEINDITNIKLQEEQLMQMNERMLMATKAGHISMWNYDIANQYFSLLGDDLSTKNGISFKDGLNHTHPEERDSIKEIFEDLCSDRRYKASFVFRFYDKVNNDYRYYEAEMHTQKDRDGNVVSILGTRRDITEKSLKEIELENARKSIDMVMEATNVFAWDYDLYTKKYRILYGDYFVKGYESLEKYWGDIYPDDRLQYESLFKKIISGELDKGMVIVHTKNKKGAPYTTYEHTIINVKNNKGEVIGLIGSMYDISKQLEYNIKLEQSRQDLNLALEAGNVSAWTYNVAKELFTTLQGDALAKGGITMKDNLKILHPDDSELQKKIFSSIINGDVKRGEAVFRYKSDDVAGGYRYYESRMIGKMDNGIVTDITGTQKDITESYLHILALEEQAKRNNLINELCEVVQWDYDLSDSILRARNTKFSMPEINTNDLTELLSIIHPEDKDKVIDFFGRLHKGIGETNHLEYRAQIDKSKKHYKTYITDAIAIKDKSGKIIKYSGIDRDMTRWVDMNEELIRQYANNDLVLSNINSGLIYMNTDRVVLWTNLGTLHDFANKLSIDKEQYTVGSKCNLYFENGECDKYHSECLIKKSIETKSTLTKEYKLSEDIFIKATAIPIFIKDSVVSGVLYKIEDITDITHTRRALEKTRDEASLANQILTEIFDKMPCVLYIKDYDDELRFVKANRAFCEYIGHTEEEVIGKTDYDLFDKVNADLQRTNDEKVVQTGTDSHYLDVISTFGDTRYWHITKSVITVASGKRYTIGIGLDITELKESSKKIEQARDNALHSNQLLNKIIDTMPGALFIKDVSDDLRYIRANNKFCKQVNKSLNGLLGKKDIEIFEEEPALLYKLTDQKLLNSEVEDIAYDTQIEINGNITYLHNTKSLIQFADGKKMIFGISVDTTDMHKINDELVKAKKKAEESDKLKSTFLANMSHEIRTPLNAIVGFSDLLCVTNDQEEREEYMKLIETNNELLLRLISDILDLTKIESGIMEMRFEKFNASELFEEIYTSFKQKLVNSEVELIKVNPYDNCIVNLDKNRLNQVISNFLTNAIKYTPSGYIKMWYECDEKGIKFYVKDTGIGISKDKHDKVFRRFEKLDDFAQGTGLGLSICKAIAEVKHGDIGFKSEEGRGSTFWVWFPTEIIIDNEQKAEIITPVVRQKCKYTECSHIMGNMNILVAEDHDSNYLLIKHLLKEYNLTRAINGAKAVELAHQNQYDMILMDIKMPVMDGLQATRLIREFNKKIPIIAVTANAFDSDRVAAMKSGCSAFITKPIRLHELKSIMDNYSESIIQ